MINFYPAFVRQCLAAIKGITRRQSQSPNAEIDAPVERAWREELAEAKRTRAYEEYRLLKVQQYREAAELLQKGVALGIPDKTMQSIIVRSHDLAREAIARKESENSLLKS